MGVSIKDIAELAGVSRGTVDRALKDRSGINAEVKAKVLKIAADLGYRSNRAGKILSIRKAPMKLGIQMPSLGNDFFLDVQTGFDQAATELADFGCSLIYRTMKGFDPHEQVRQIRELLAEGIHGLAFVPINHDLITQLMDELAQADIPVMTFNTDIANGKRLCYVGNDYHLSGATAAGVLRLLAKERMIRVLILTGSIQVLGHNQRILGFSQIQKKHENQIRILDIVETLDDEEVAYDRTLEAIGRLPDLDAIYITAGGVAGACRAIEQAGLDQQIRVICNDLTPATRHYLARGTITATIGQHPYDQGYQSIHLLFDYLLDGTKPPDQWITPCEIIIPENMEQ